MPAEQRKIIDQIDDIISDAQDAIKEADWNIGEYRSLALKVLMDKNKEIEKKISELRSISEKIGRLRGMREFSEKLIEKMKNLRKNTMELFKSKKMGLGDVRYVGICV